MFSYGVQQACSSIVYAVPGHSSVGSASTLVPAEIALPCVGAGVGGCSESSQTQHLKGVFVSSGPR
jgi:O-acetyl-ADP-ribose deacetylase (regulator of RNase III)